MRNRNLSLQRLNKCSSSLTNDLCKVWQHTPRNRLCNIRPKNTFMKTTMGNCWPILICCFCSMLIAYCLWSIAHRQLPISDCIVPLAYRLLPVAYCLLPIADCLLPVACRLLPVAYCLLHIINCILPIAHPLLPMSCCLLLIACDLQHTMQHPALARQASPPSPLDVESWPGTGSSQRTPPAHTHTVRKGQLIRTRGCSKS